MTNSAAVEQKTDIATSVDLETGTLTLSIKTGEAITVRLSQLSQAMNAMAALHGLKQKVMDAAAIKRDPETGRAASLAVKFAAMREVADRIVNDGEWNKTREGGSGGGSMLLRALCIVYEGRKTPEQLKAYLDGKSDKEKATIRALPAVAEALAKIRAEAEKAKGSEAIAETLLDELENLE